MKRNGTVVLSVPLHVFAGMKMNKKIEMLKLFFYYFSISISVLLTLFIFQKKMDDIKEIHYLYSEDAVEISMPDMELKDVIEYIEAINTENATIIATGLHPFLELKSIYYDGKTYELPMVEGRFLTGEESRGTEDIVVVGYQYKEKIYVKNEKKYYKIDGREYEVVGIMGRKYGSRFNTMIFLPFGVAAKRCVTSGIYQIDGEKKELEDRLISRNLQDKRNMKKIYTDDVREFFGEVRKDNGVMGIYFLIVCLTIIGSFFGMLGYLEINTSSVIARKIMGMSSWEIIKIYFKKYSGILTLAIIMSLICGTVITIITSVHFSGYFIICIGLLIFWGLMNIETLFGIVILMKNDVGEKR